ncbi:hypothetical protein SASPL_109463 [Salvia splendens]|uniref:VTT domain-containing protein n=1 Tax=Salvia splendens TaxID=180675 RepID=A0A8X9A975_SALSN|nr:hypothetical protein SASPL_109463 [Salvia splendens]
MPYNAGDEEYRRLVADYVKLEGGGGGQWHADTSTSGCCGGDTGGGDEIIPMINWVQSTFSTTILGLIVFASLAIFPVFLIPSTPSQWVAGMTFGYGYGFLLITGGVLIGSSIPYFIATTISSHMQAWLERHPKRASILRLAGEGNWFSQFRAVSLIRISPFPYIIYNYCAVATDVRYVPYLLGTAVGMVPDIIVALYT